MLVTRPADQAGRTAARLRELGHEPVLAPVLRIVPTGEPTPEGGFAAVLLTSGNAVQGLSALRDRLGGTAVLAVGNRTAAAARAAGFGQVVSAEGAGADLVRLAAARAPSGARLLHIGGRDRKPGPELCLRRAGFEVAIWEAYEARMVEALPDAAAAALSGGSLDAALHFSRRSAGRLVALVAALGLEPELGRLAHACLSEDVAAPLRPLRPSRVAIAPQPDEAGMLAALASLADPAAGSPPPQSG
ncbi:MAG: hypothetical protein JWR08_1146 [Enterovirga sp.]|nr:hypothetical protein [Enterovirga sp.]